MRQILYTCSLQGHRPFEVEHEISRMSSYRHMQHQGHAVFPTSPLPGREGEGRGRAERILVRRAAVAHRSGRPLAATARLVRALTTLHRLALSPGPSAHTPPSRPSSRSWVPPSTACTPRQSGTTTAGPYPWEQRRPSQPCRRHWHRAWYHTSLFPVSMVRPMCRRARPWSRGSAA